MTMNTKLTLYIALIILLLAPVGAYCATETLQQKDEENSATGGSSKGLEKDSSGMESLSDLTKNQPPSPEFLQTIQERQKTLDAREKDLARREKQLLLLQRDVTEKQIRIEDTLANLETLAQKMDKSRDKDFAKSVQRFTAMEAEQAAQILIQMDLESVKAILLKMETSKAAGILGAMQENVTKGTDSPENQAKREKVGEIGQALAGTPKKTSR